jgi:hypothetical protein
MAYREGLSSVVQRVVSNQGLESRNLTLTFNPVKASWNRNYVAGLTGRDQNTYIAGIRELIDLDAVLVVASGNISVSPYQQQ